MTRYKLQHITQAQPDQTPSGLFTEILMNIAKSKSKRVRSLVFQSHGNIGEIWIFGKSNFHQPLNASNVSEFKRLAGKVEVIWILGCTTCADRAYMKSIVEASKANVVGVDTGNPQKGGGLYRNEIDFDMGARPVVMDANTKALIWRGDFVGQATTSAHIYGEAGLVNFRPV